MNKLIFPSVTVADRPTRELSKRQREVLTLITKGLSNKEIARILCIAEATIKIHVAAALRVIGARNRTQAAFEFGREDRHEETYARARIDKVETGHVPVTGPAGLTRQAKDDEVREY